VNADCQLGRGDKTCSTESCESIGDDANGVTPVVTHSMPVVAKCPGSGRLSAVCTAEMGDELVAVDLGPGRTALQISAGEKHTCAVLVSGPSEILSLSLSLSLSLRARYFQDRHTRRVASNFACALRCFSLFTSCAGRQIDQVLGSRGQGASRFGGHRETRLHWFSRP
jgi:hypothetical protein